MKLSLNFSLYKGTTKLKDWWKAVKSHFEAVQTAHNALEDEVAAEKTRLSTEITQRTNDVNELQGYIDSEIGQIRNDMEFKTMTYIGKYPYFGEDDTLGETFFYLKNEGPTTDRILVNDEIGYILSEPILAGDTRLCIVTKGCVTGADLEWGFIYVIPKSDHIGAETNERKSEDKKLSNRVDVLEGEVAGLTVKEVVMKSPMGCSEQLSSDYRSYNVDVNVDEYTISAYGKQYHSIGYTFPAEFRECSGYLYAVITILPDGEIDNEDGGIYNADDLNGITRQSDGSYKVMWLIGQGHHYYAPGPENEPAANYSFQQIENGTHITFYNEGDWHGKLEAEEAERITEDEVIKSELTSLSALVSTLSSLTTEHQIFVPCDGDHDELKLQAAIDSAPENSVIYPVGTCVITNDNIQMGVGGMADTYGAILNIKEKCTLDGRYCHSMTFVNSNPQTNQVIFLLQANTKMKNLDFSEDLNSTANPPVPSVIYNRSVCEISNCKFTDLTDTGASQNKIISITGSGNVFKDNTLSRLHFSAYPSSSSDRIAITADVTGNTFAEGYADSQNSSEMMSFTGLVSNNRFDNMELLGGAISFYGGIREGVHGNKFNRMPNAQFDFHCSVVANTFATCSAETERMSLIQLSGSASNQTLFTANTLSAIRATADNVSLISVTGEYCKVSDNIIVITQAVGETAGIDTIGKAQVHHNTVKLSAFAANSTTLDVFRGSDGAVITDNITDATSLGTFDDTCVVERNITAEVS